MEYNYKNDFPLLAHSDIAYLDSAATAQRPACVLDAERRFYETMNANPLRGLYSLSVAATAEIDRVREQVARLIGAVGEDGRPLAQDVVFTRNTSESLNLVAKSFSPLVLKAGDEVCVTIMEHHSDLIPWQQACRAAGATLVFLYPNEDGVITDEEIAAKIGPKTRICAAAEVSNVLGIRLPVEKIAAAVHAQGGYMVVDGAQSVPHMAVDVRALGADFLAFSAHKALGPMGIGVLWGKMDLLNAMPPMLTGGEMIDSVTEQDAVWAPVPEALTYLTQTVGYEAVAAREAALVAYAWERMGQLDFVELIGHPEPSQHHGVISFNVRGVHPHDVASILDMSGVCIRAGHHCAQPLLTWLGVENLACCRASLAFYNDQSDVNRLVDALTQVWQVFHGRD